MKTYSHLYEKLETIENIELAVRESQLGKQNHYGVKLYNCNKKENFEKIMHLIKDMSFHTSQYKSKIIYEPKKRIIYMLPYNPDRIIHHALINVLMPYFTDMFIKEVARKMPYL